MSQVMAPRGTTLLRLRELCDDLEGSEFVLQNFFTMSPDLLAVINRDGFFLQSNPSWQKILGWPRIMMDEATWPQFVHADDQALVFDAIHELADNDLHHLVCRMKHRNGQYWPVEFSATQWRGGVSNLVGRMIPIACLSCPEASPRLTRRAHGCGNHKERRS